MDAIGGDGDGDRALGAFFQEWPFGLLVVVDAVGVGEFHVARAEDFESVVEIGSWGERLRAKAGAGVVDFKKCYGLAAVIDDGGHDIRGAAAGEGDGDER